MVSITQTLEDRTSGSLPFGDNRQMRFSWATLARRSLVSFAATCCLAIAATLASAQTVIVRHAPPGSTVELVVGATPAGTAKTDAEGTATVIATGNADATIDASVWVDACGDARRVILGRPGAPPAADPGCTRTQIEGVYVVQRITSIVIDVRGPSLRIRQGPAPAAWLRDPVPGVAGSAAEALPPLTGLTLFGGGGLGAASDFKSQACGNVTSCSDNAALPYSGGVVWWFTDFVGAEARYGYLGDLEAEGSGDAFRFTTTREGGVLAFTGRAGVRIGRVRPYGRGGLGLHRATLTTTQTVNDSTVVIGGATQTVPGGTQILQVRTKGWAPVYGGGVEVWLSPFLGIYGEAQRIELKGDDDRGADIEIDDAVITAQVGLTVRFP